MTQLDIRRFLQPIKPVDSVRNKTRQLSISSALHNLKHRSKLQKKQRKELYKSFNWKQIPHLSSYKGFKKGRFRQGIAYLVNKCDESIDIVAIDIKTQIKVGSCEFDDLTLTHLNVIRSFRRKRIGLTFLRLANRLLRGSVLFCTSQLINSRFRLSTDAMHLVNFAREKRIINSNQLIDVPMYSPVSSPSYGNPHNLRHLAIL